MTTEFRSTTVTAFASLAAVTAVCLLSTTALAQPGRGGFGLDPRAEDRTYHFTDTNEELPYCVFVSSKVSKDEPAPLIVSLHGLGAGPQIMCNSTAVNLAEEGGYILVSPMGYNVGGWYGSPVLRGPPPGSNGRGANGPTAMTFDAINRAGPDGKSDDHLTLDEVRAYFDARTPAGNGRAANGPGAGGAGDFVATAFQRWDTNTDGRITRQEFDDRPQPAGFGGGNQPENLAELSEKDVMNVLAMVRKEFNVDPRRIYLTGHSMGGAGTYFLGSKHADIFAAIAPVAPAAFSMMPNRVGYLKPLKEAGVAIMVVHGDIDEAVPVETSRDNWVPSMKELGIEYQYVELPGVSHGPIITASQKYIYEFFAKHAK